MAQSKTALLTVASILGLLVLAPLLALWLLKEPSGDFAATDSLNALPTSSNAPANYTLQALEARVTELLDQQLSTAVQEQKVSVQRMAYLQKLREKAALAMQRGRWEQAQQSYELLEQEANAELQRLQLMADCAQKERALYHLLEHLEPFQTLFEKTYQQLVARYDQAGAAYQEQAYAFAIQLYDEAVDQASAARAHADAHLDALLDSGKLAMDEGAIEQAEQHYRAALKLVPELVRAKEALQEIEQLRSVDTEVQRAKAYVSDRQWDAALAIWEALLQRYPNSDYIRKQAQQAQDSLLAAQVAELLQQAENALAADDVPKAIELFLAADAVQPSEVLQARVRRLKEQLRAQELETSLQAAYRLLEIGQYAQARQLYAELKNAYPQNSEVQTGLAHASRLNVAHIKYRENLQTSERYDAAGKFPLAIQFFNAALASRPSHLNAADRDREAKLDERLKLQLQAQTLELLSDGRTYVSVVGVLAPAQFERKRLSVQPDVYQIKGERPGYQSVQVELKLNAQRAPGVIRVVCGEKL
jgi:tetratricopeptide (TPR) repeat protein